MEYTFSREALTVAYAQPAAVEGARQDRRVTLHGQHLRPDGLPCEGHTAFVMMHPNGVLQTLRLPEALARAGMHTVCCASRYMRNDSCLLMEAVVVDLGAVLAHCLRPVADDGMGFARVVLVGWSGGASLALFYQSQAESPTVERLPSGRPFRLACAELPRASAVVVVCGHRSRAHLMAELIDPAVTDERDFRAGRAADLDLYAPGRKITPEWVARYREAQAARVARITEWVRAELRRPGAEDVGFVVHGTLADPRWLDASLDPNGRAEGTCFFGKPEECNNRPQGMGRFSSLHSWLSQWSPADTQCDGVAAGARLTRTPVLMIAHEADNICTPSHTNALWNALEATKAEHKAFVLVPNAGHGDAPLATVNAIRLFAQNFAPWPVSAIDAAAAAAGVLPSAAAGGASSSSSASASSPAEAVAAAAAAAAAVAHAAPSATSAVAAVAAAANGLITPFSMDAMDGDKPARRRNRREHANSTSQRQLRLRGPTSEHSLKHMEGGRVRWCVVCTNSESGSNGSKKSVGHKTRLLCERCLVPLCVGECWKIYHSEVQLKHVPRERERKAASKRARPPPSPAGRAGDGKMEQQHQQQHPQQHPQPVTMQLQPQQQEQQPQQEQQQQQQPPPPPSGVMSSHDDPQVATVVEPVGMATTVVPGAVGMDSIEGPSRGRKASRRV